MKIFRDPTSAETSRAPDTCTCITLTPTPTPTCGAYPVNFAKVGERSCNEYGDLVIVFQWESSTGHLPDLEDVGIREYVDYDGPGPTCTWPDPPWLVTVADPTITGVWADSGEVEDHNKIGNMGRCGDFVKESVGFTSAQKFQYSCNTEGGEEVDDPGWKTGNWTTLMYGPVVIEHDMSYDSGGRKWVLTISRDDCDQPCQTDFCEEE